MTTGSKLDGPVRPDDDLVKAAELLPPCDDICASWRGLSALPQKADLYWRESLYRESYADLTAALGDSLAAFCQRLALVVFRPEAIAGRRVEAGLRFLRDHGFDAVHWQFTNASPMQAREVWRYQWNVATLDRLAVFDLVTAQGPWLLVFLADATSRPVVPASVRLRGLKGSALPERRSGDSLRCSIDAPNRILSVLHAPDEPMDIVRELGILFNRAERGDVVARLRTGLAAASSRRTIEEIVAAAYAKSSRTIDFHLTSATERVLASLDATRDGAAAAHLRAAAAGSTSLPFRDWITTLGQATARIDDWDLITVGSYLATHDIIGKVCTIDDDGRLEWFGGHGRMEWKGSRKWTRSTKGTTSTSRRRTTLISGTLSNPLG